MIELVKNICRFICGMIDYVAYRVLSSLYDLFTQIAQLTLYSEKAMKVISQRVFLILGIFMLFRIAISLVSYLISPDKTNDSSKGGKKLITNIIVSLALLATVNIIFEQAYKLQKKVVESQIIEKIFFGKTGNNNEISMSFMLYSAFIKPNDKLVSNCDNLFDEFQPLSADCSYSLTNADLSNKIRTEINRINREHDFSETLRNYEMLNYDIDGEYFFDYFPIISTICAIVVIIMLISFSLDLSLRIVKLLFLQIIAPIPIISNMEPSKGEAIFKKWLKQCSNTYLSLFIRIIAVNFAVFMIILIKTEFSDIFIGKSIFITVFLIIGCLLFAKQVPNLIEDMLGIKFDGMVLHPMKRFQEQALFGKNITSLRNAGISGAMGLGAGLIGAGAASKALGNGLGKNALSAAIGAGRGLVGGLGAGYKSKNTFDAFKTGIARKNSEAEHVNSLDGTDFGGRVKAGLQQRFNVPTNEERTKKGLEKLGEYSSSIDAMLKRSEAESIKQKEDFKVKDSSGNILSIVQHKQEKERLTRMRNEDMSFEEFAKKEGINTKIKDYNEFAKQFKNGMGRDANSSDYETYKEQMQQMIDSAREKHNNYKLEHDAELQRLNDKINKDTKIFANEYATQVAKGEIDDPETKAYIKNIEKIREELEKQKIISKDTLEKDFDIFEILRDENGNALKDENGDIIKYLSGDKAKKSKGKADAYKYSFEHSEKYERAKANAAATKPNKK